MLLKLLKNLHSLISAKISYYSFLNKFVEIIILNYNLIGKGENNEKKGC